jgi:hypothetical protein
MISLLERIGGPTDAGVSDPCQRDSNGQQQRRENQKKLGRGRKARESLGNRHCATRSSVLRLAELPKQVEEIVGHRFPQCVVVNGAQRSAEIAAALLGGIPLRRR